MRWGTDDALIATREMLQLDPLVPIFWWRLGAIGASEDRRELVAEARDRMRAIDPTFRYAVLADFYLEFWQGRIELARDALAKAMRFAPVAAAADAELFRWSLREPGVDDAQARRAIMARPDYFIYAARGDADLFFAALTDEQARAWRYYLYLFISVPVAQPLLADPRAKGLLNRYGFVTYWREKGWPALCRPLGSDDFECGAAARKD
jgi:hypothetical protein